VVVRDVSYGTVLYGLLTFSNGAFTGFYNL
jgi:hypothetical protein